MPPHRLADLQSGGAPRQDVSLERFRIAPRRTADQQADERLSAGWDDKYLGKVSSGLAI